jgi:hypothetical protein
MLAQAACAADLLVHCNVVQHMQFYCPLAWFSAVHAACTVPAWSLPRKLLFEATPYRWAAVKKCFVA